MPYIDPHDRPIIDEHIDPVIPFLSGPGDLNYAMTKLAAEYLDMMGTSYAHFNEVIGVLECAKQELYRRMVVPYEERKCAENGDVYP
jgi:hypothetical protein